MTNSTTAAKAAPTKKDQIKTAIMNFLNESVGSVARKEINAKIGGLGSSRTVSRALAELKLSGQAIHNESGKTWVSTEAKKEESAPINKGEKEESAPELPIDETKTDITPAPETTFVYEIKNKDQTLLCGSCKNEIIEEDETCTLCGKTLVMENLQKITVKEYAKLVPPAPTKTEEKPAPVKKDKKPADKPAPKKDK
ncbi:MAG: hypothetical protein PF503_06370, partial [Desulfobacula sp.]|nr:hypothetical protein [Desulfobacula sp.]